jgi:hypothetical protein
VEDVLVGAQTYTSSAMRSLAFLLFLVPSIGIAEAEGLDVSWYYNTRPGVLCQTFSGPKKWLAYRGLMDDESAARENRCTLMPIGTKGLVIREAGPNLLYMVFEIKDEIVEAYVLEGQFRTEFEWAYLWCVMGKSKEYKNKCTDEMREGLKL